VFPDEATGKAASRPEWDKCLAQLRKGDVLVVTKLDRIGRSLVNLVDVVRLLGERGVGLKVLDQDIDTSTPGGKLPFHIMSALAEWEAAIISERTIEGLEAARERHGGTLPVRGPEITRDQVTTAEGLVRAGMPAKRIAEVIGVSRAGLYRHVDVAGIREEAQAGV
jgi:DNA invertase Pin-like site-specific DNA recombinase